MIRILALLFVMLLSAQPAYADDLRPGYLEMEQQDSVRWRLVWKAPISGNMRPETQPVLPENCQLEDPLRREMATAAVISRGIAICRGGIAGKHIGLSNFSGVQTDVLVRIAPLDEAVQALRLTASAPVAQIPARSEMGNVAWTYFVIGIEHILFGFDHLLFVLCLVFLISGGWAIAKTVTAFTIAHSITLACVTLGLFGLPQQPVEILIALSIIFLAVEIVKKDPAHPRLAQRIPWVVAFIFGLLHGFGFAGALREIGLPQGEVPTALLTFNLGVEAGQLMIVVVSLTILGIFRHIRADLMIPATRVASYAIGIVASVWFIERLFA